MSDGLSVAIKRFSERTKSAMVDVRVKVMDVIFTRIIERTPIKTGLARGNWQTSVGFPKQRFLPLRPWSDALEEMRAVIKESGNRTVFFVNTAPYIGALEYGSSAQAPEGMVRTTLATVGQVVSEAVAGVK